MIVLSKLDQLNPHIAKAAEVQPPCRVIEFGLYEVRGSSGDWYEVRCRKLDNGQRLVSCSCEQKFNRRGGVGCYHMVPAVGAHILLAIAQRSVIIAYESKSDNK